MKKFLSVIALIMALSLTMACFASCDLFKKEEQKDQVIFDKENLKDLTVISGNYVTLDHNMIRHDVNKLSIDIYKYLIESSE